MRSDGARLCVLQLLVRRPRARRTRTRTLSISAVSACAPNAHTHCACAVAPAYGCLSAIPDAQLVALHTEFASSGLEIFAFPCNEFGQQEPGTNEEVAAFAAARGVRFTLFAKTNVNSKCLAPKSSCQPHSSACCPSNSGVFDVLRKALPAKQNQPLAWNFEKFLVGRDGRTIARYPTSTTPKDLVPKIRKALAAEAPSAMKQEL